ncbi:unnamed protein product [Merluccius merluccius]
MDVAGTTKQQESALRTLAACNTRWRCAAALLAVALCVAGVTLYFTTHDQGRRGENDGKYNINLTTSVEWKKDEDQFFSEGGLELKDNEIAIPHNGLYFVYSQASFRVSCHADDDQSVQMVHLSHTVKRWSDSYSNYQKTYETILHSVRTACEKTLASDRAALGKWFNAVYMGAVFHLNKGDRLKTEMEAKLLPDVEDGHGNTFFGVFAL